MARELVQRVVVGAVATNSISFTSIPQDGKSLIVEISGRNNYASSDRSIGMTVNGAIYSSGLRLKYNGSTISSGTGTTLSIPAATVGTGAFSSIRFLFPTYTRNSSQTVLIDQGNVSNNTGGIEVMTQVSRVSSGNVTSLTFFFSAGNGDWIEGTSISVYKVS